ncbi:MAG: LPS assembly protein LptD, partial [Alphaproteobacteria bacterium]|nr:LPS assembly protein LptD [Alphaproteobacteria bacterium]
SRVTGDVHWTQPFLMSNGWKWTLDLSSRTDFYTYNNTPLADGSTLSTDEVRWTPQAMLQWEWQLFKSGEKTSQTLTPIVQFITSPQNKNVSDILNSDSLGLRLDDTNLLSANRFQGYDRIETGSRINYGFGWDLFGYQGGKVNAFMGQSYRFEKDESIASETSLDDGFSNFAGRLLLDFNQSFKSAYRVQIDKNTLSFNRQEFDLFLDLKRFYFQTNYILNRDQDASVTDTTASEEIYGKTFVKFTSHWGTYFYDRFNLTQDEQTEMGLGFIFENDCFRFDLGAKREYMADRDYEGNDSIFVTFTFKTLGSAGMGDSWEEIKNENRW